MADKKYIGGSAKAVSTQYDEILNLSLKLEDMQAIANEKGYVNMTVLKRKEPGQYGDTHYVVENDIRKIVKKVVELLQVLLPRQRRWMYRFNYFVLHGALRITRLYS